MPPALLVYSLVRLDYLPSVLQMVLYPGYLLCGVAMMYSLMIALAATSIWLGQNQTLYDFWFYITNFSRYPMEIYRGPYGDPLRHVFTFVVPVLVVVNVPARLLAKPLEQQNWPLAGFAIVAAAGSLVVSRWIFQRPCCATAAPAVRRGRSRQRWYEMRGTKEKRAACPRVERPVSRGRIEQATPDVHRVESRKRPVSNCPRLSPRQAGQRA